MDDSARDAEIEALEYLLTLPSPPDRITRIEMAIEANFARAAAHLAVVRRMCAHLKRKGGA